MREVYSLIVSRVHVRATRLGLDSLELFFSSCGSQRLDPLLKGQMRWIRADKKHLIYNSRPIFCGSLRPCLRYRVSERTS